MKKITKVAQNFVEYKISLKELYFSLSTWLILLITFLGFTTKFNTALLLINLVIALVIYFVMILLTNRVLLSGFLTLLMAVCFDYVKQIKWQFLMQEMSAADFFMIKLLVSHGLFRLMYEYATKEIYLIFLLLFLNFVLLWNKSDTLFDKYKLEAKNYYALKLLSFGVAILLILKLFDVAIDKKSYFYWAIESTKSQADKYPRKIYGPFADVLFTLQDIQIAPIPGKIDEELVLSKIEKNQHIVTDINDMPDIIVILNESTFDPSKLDYDFAENFDFQFFKKNTHTKYNGIMNVNTYGGSSWISEYEINTGIPHKYFSGPSYMPFITLVPKTEISLISYLKSLGYRTEVIYPVDKNFSLAEESYTALGANSITDIYEYGFKPTSWGNIPDSVIGDMIIDALDKNPEKPKYIFAATMLNHGPHSSYFKDKIGCGLLMDDNLCSKLNDYIDRLTKTNKDQMNLTEKLMNRKRKTILVNFGDHLPSFEGYSTQIRFSRDVTDYYKTFYNVVANFDIQDQSEYPSMDITFIPGLILDMANLNDDKFYKANSLMRKSCNGQIGKCFGSNKNLDDLIQSYKSLVVKQLGY
jgi:phosphoglycerol transferase MdoB-like AlkP superfamily enzyme